MNQPVNTPDPKSKKDQDSSSVSNPRATRRGGGLIGLLLVTVLIIGGAAAFAGWKFWQEFESTILSTSADNASLKASQRQLENSIRTMQDALATTQQLDEIAASSVRNRVQLSDRISQTEQAIESLQQAVSGDNTSLARAQARYLVQVANDELLLRSNVGNALAALRAADTRLRDAGNALFSNVRAKLAQDILALESLPDPDITGMALTLASLANVVESLPLRKADSPHNTGEEALPDEAGAWQRFKAATKRLFSSVVTVRHDTDLRPFVTPEQEYFLLRNLELKLESTRLSLLMQDTANFQAGADVTVEWLERYFDTSDSAVAAAREQLLIMRDTELPATFPDLSGTLRMLEIAEHN